MCTMIYTKENTLSIFLRRKKYVKNNFKKLNKKSVILLEVVHFWVPGGGSFRRKWRAIFIE